MYITIFIISLFCLGYTYVFYPYILSLFSIIHAKEVDKREWYPKVSLIISAYNERQYIKKKIANSLSLNYPGDKLQIIVASDCSNDDTDTIVSQYENQGIKLVRLPRRGGKTATQNYEIKFFKRLYMVTMAIVQRISVTIVHFWIEACNLAQMWLIMSFFI